MIGRRLGTRQLWAVPTLQGSGDLALDLEGDHVFDGGLDLFGLHDGQCL